MTENDREFKSWFILVFSSNYLFQGFVTSMFTVIVPIYLLIMIAETGTAITASEIASIASIILLPWAIKFLYGLLSDKYGIKNFGRRKPWIIFPTWVAGLVWIILPVLITPLNVITVFTIAGLIINVGVAMADTALDGLILDICPKEQLGRAQGTCWGFRSVGQIAGGPLLAFLVVGAGMQVEVMFMVLGILMIGSSFLILIIKEPPLFMEINLGQNFKEMFTSKEDWKMYFFALFNAIIDGVVLLFLALYLLIQMDIIAAEGASLELLEDSSNLNIYMQQASISLIVSIGIVIGAVSGGLYSDMISRKYSVFISLFLSTAALFLILIPFPWQVLLIIAALIGAGMGWRHSSYSAVLGEYSKKHPELIGTYFSVANSFVNIGTIIGLSLVGLIFKTSGSFIFAFVFMAIISNIGIIPFLLLKTKDYESKITKNISK